MVVQPAACQNEFPKPPEPGKLEPANAGDKSGIFRSRPVGLQASKDNKGSVDAP